MIPSDHFVRFYNEVFKALAERGHDHLEAYWRELGRLQTIELADKFRTGGLADTVVDATPTNLEAGTATGFVFEHANLDGLWYAMHQAVNLRHRSPDGWQQLAITGMLQDFSWDASARRYEALYLEAISARRADAAALASSA